MLNRLLRRCRSGACCQHGLDAWQRIVLPRAATVAGIHLSEYVHDKRTVCFGIPQRTNGYHLPGDICDPGVDSYSSKAYVSLEVTVAYTSTAALKLSLNA